MRRLIILSCMIYIKFSKKFKLHNNGWYGFYFFAKWYGFNSYRILNNKFNPFYFFSLFVGFKLGCNPTMFNSKKEDEPNGIKPGHGSNLKTMNDLQSLQRDNEWPYGPERKEKKKKNRPMWLCLPIVKS